MGDRRETEVTVFEKDALGEISSLSRRSFLKCALLGTAGGVLFSFGAIGCAFRLAQNQVVAVDPSPFGVKAHPKPAIGYITRVSVEASACVSCGLCSLVCAAVHGDTVGPSSASIWLERKPFECEYSSITCQQCDLPECYFACKTEGAFYIDDKTGARAIDSKKCIGCKQCIEACVFDPPRICWDSERGVAFKCDLCSGRPEGPACVEFCPSQALTFIKEVGA